MDDSTTTDVAATDESAGDDKGVTPAPEKDTAGESGKTFDAEYVKQLRREAADNRRKLEAADKRLREFEDRDKSESEKLATRVAESEARASEAETKALRYEVAHAHGLDMSAAAFLTGTTREEIDARATELAKLLTNQSKPAPTPSFDGGARKTPDETKTPEQAHSDFLLRALGRTPAE